MPKLLPSLVMLSLLAPLAPFSPGQERKPEKLPAAAKSTLVVEVVDAAGKPCAKVPVALVVKRGEALGKSGLPEEEQKRAVRRVDFLSSYVALAASDDKEGRASFDLAAHPLAPQEFESCVARLCLPLLDPVEVVFDPKKLPEQPLRLVRPDCGTVRFDLSGIDKGSVRIRAFDEDEPDSIWSPTAPDRFPVAAGVAQIPFAPVGVELAYEATWEGLGTPLTGHFAGPSRAGEEVRFAPPSLASYPRLHGRVIDEEANAVANRKIEFSVTLTQKGKEAGVRGEATTDGGGFFDFAVVAELLPGCKGTLRCSAAAAAQGEKDLGAADALVELKKLLAGPNEVGELVLVAPGSLRWLARLSDDELQKTYESRKTTSGTRRLDVEACLVEMGRRKSDRWKKYLEKELAALHPAAKAKKAKSGKGHDGEEDAGEAAADLSLLTALRRAQGKPDPLALVLGAPPPYDAIFPETPKVAFSLKNVDAAKETFGFTEGGSYRSGRFARIHVEATGPDGARVPVRTQFGMMGGGMSGRGRLAAGESHPGEVKLGDFISFPGPGVYQVRLSYHDSEEIANDDRIDGFVVATSPEFTVRLKSQSVTVKRAELDALKEKFKSIDFTEKVPLVAGHWSADLKFDGAPKTPQDHVFRAGYAAVPMLLELLDDATLTIEQRSWVFGLLWDITGINNPEHGEFFAAVKDPVWLTDWPGSLVKTAPNFNEFGTTSGGGWPDHQKGLAARWKLMKSWFDVKVVK
jgi:hypothetical protein